MAKTVLVPIAQGIEEMEAVIIIDMLRRAGIRVEVVADANIITGSRGVKIIPDMFYEDIDENQHYDAIIIPGGKQGVEYMYQNNNLQDIIYKHHENNGIIGAICAAPTLLYDLRLLKENTTVTSHPSVKSVFSGMNYSENSVVVSNAVITSRGAGTAFDFALQLIEILTDSETADIIKNDIVL